MAYESHHLSLEEQWFVRDHPFNIKVVAVKRIIAELDEAEAEVARIRRRLEVAVTEMNTRKDTSPAVAEEAVEVRAPRRRVVRGF